MFLLDTNVISDAAKKTDSRLNKFLESQAKESLFISALSLAEISYGVHLLPAGKKKARLITELDRIEKIFTGQILEIDAQVALRYGELQAGQTKRGFNDHAFDNLLIATAIVNNLTIVTKNKKHFIDRGVRLHYPI